MDKKIQQLSAFSQPADFRGRPGWMVQLWWLTWFFFFRTSPQFMFGFRRWLLRLFGAQIGKKVLIRPSCNITYPWKLTIGNYSWVGDEVVLYTLGPITIGDNVVVSQRSYICTGSHDYQAVAFDIYAKPIVIENEAWLATDVFVAPGVTIGMGAVVGARSSVYKDMPACMICIGNPAKPVKSRI
ncbi:putative colanic acid biosynthesis acetyltransferase [Deminuibacter soli]|uniref:Colanic acid biosynthesis acetyltransferase WcaF n=1 Tax=Deminuibacter soli TaxID=2291815 RepID=A0A3E1NHR5_9BACT|nr:putative colanic acid biosynthesis acetyltransferase [Deminuibacter soli]RFM27394.1 colanic acid biosynthesis acetyltransferase WcaF [Deminuibacter soli]